MCGQELNYFLSNDRLGLGLRATQELDSQQVWTVCYCFIRKYSDTRQDRSRDTAHAHHQ